MLFGSKQRFAIEADVCYFTDYGVPIGPTCLWIVGTRIGDPSSTEPLGVCVSGFETAIEDTGTRVDATFNVMPKEQVVWFLWNAIFGRNERSLEEEEDLAGKYNKFILCPYLGESFDDDFVVIVDVSSKIRVIWQDKSPFENVV